MDKTITLKGKRVIIAGLFSVKEADPESLLYTLSSHVEAMGATVIGTVIQRRGVSRGGVHRLESPMSAVTLFGRGKAQELAAFSKKENADLILFWNELGERQVRNLEKLCDTTVRDWQSLGLRLQSDSSRTVETATTRESQSSDQA